MASFTWFESFDRALSLIPEQEDRNLLTLALVSYGSAGVEPELEYPLNAIFESLRDDIDNSIKARKGGSNGGSKSVKKAKKAPSKSEETEKEPPLVTPLDNPPSEPPLVTPDSKLIQYKPIQNNTNQSNTEHTHSLPVRCLALFNEIFGTTYATMPPRNAEYLNGLHSHYSDEDIGSMIRYKRDEWSNTRFKNNLTPKTLFSPEHFEQYMQQSKMQAEEVNKYAKYD